MGVIENPTGQPLDPELNIGVPAKYMPGFRLLVAHERGTKGRLLIRMTGGIGDNVCAEPAVRYAINHFPDTQVSVIGEDPDLFRHLPLKNLWHSKKVHPDLNKFLVLDSFMQDGELTNDFLAPAFIHCVDYPTLLMFRSQIPRADRCIKLVPTEDEMKHARTLINPQTDILVHAGQSWPSKTMPKDWWDAVLERIVAMGLRPVLIGSQIKHEQQPRGTVDVNPWGCLDLRNRLTIMGSVALMHTAKVVLTNDSAPLHLAASSEAWIGFLNTIRHPEINTHYRNGGEFGWRMQNHTSGGLWQTMNTAPNNMGQLLFHQVDEQKLRSWLPAPADFAAWAIGKLGLMNGHA